ncbi:MAG: xanthine dehydrogenase family protein molybdopterin-binding subunit [Chloroflexota bacterium]|nr:xanthine dehydrogenase family protein molybdopterin-binding subunit [Chloroflexota bacterium]
MEYTIIGKRFPRLDGREKVTGQAQYTADITLPNMLYGKILRSPYAHARILNIDTSRAEKLAGVKAIVSSKNTPKSYMFGIDIYDEPLLAWDDIVRFAGQEVAGVAATDKDIAVEAIDLIKVDYEELPAVFDPAEAVKPGAPQVHPELPYVKNNIAFEVTMERGDIEQGFREADVVVEDSFSVAPVTQCYLEPDACLASYDASDRLTVWVGNMWPSLMRDELARTLQIPVSKVRVIQKYVGGAFGARFTMYPLHFIASLLSMKAGRPVKLVRSRTEEFTLPRYRPAVWNHFRLGARKDGTITAIQTEVVMDNGAYQYLGRRQASHMCCRSDANYRFKNLKYHCINVYTNKAPPGTYRSFGDAEMTFGREQMMDILAEKLGMDTAELKLKNCARTGDISPHGWHLNSVGVAECIEKSTVAAGWKDKKAHKQPRRGIGIASTCHETDDRNRDGFYGSVSFVKILEDGRVQVITGEAEYGQGAHNAVAMVAAEELGVRPQDVEVPHHDTDYSPWALGAVGSRVMAAAVTATRLATLDARKQALDVAAAMLKAKPEELAMKDGKVYVASTPDRSVTMADIGHEALHRRGGSLIMGKGVEERWDTEYTLKAAHPTHFGHSVSATYYDTTIAEVEVDTTTGEVKVLNVVVADDCGKVIDQQSIDGQVQGATVQGLGAALFEERILDEKGRIANANFLDYKVPLSVNVPPIEKIYVESNEPGFAYGCKGGGESPGIGSIMPAIANAIYDAIGVRIKSTPITREKVLQALAEKEAKR